MPGKIFSKEEKQINQKKEELSKADLDLLEAAKEDLAGVKKAIKNGANVNAVSKEGNTALHIAVSNGNLSVVTHLLSIEGINVFAENKKGDMPLNCTKWNKPHIDKIITLLNDAMDSAQRPSWKK